MKSILISHVFGFANKGDWALLDSLLQVLQIAFPGCNVRGICRDPNSQALRFPAVHWYQQLGTSYRNGIGRRIENMFGLLKGIFREYTGCDYLSPNSPPACFRDIDLIVACPGGYLEDTNVSIITNYVHLWLALRSGVPVILAPQSIGPFRSRFWSNSIAVLLRQCAAICVRESISEALVVEKMGVPRSRVHLLPDMAFYFPQDSTKNMQSIMDSFGLRNADCFAAATTIDWYFPFATNSSYARARYIKELARTLRLLYERWGLKTILLKQVEKTGGLKGDDQVIAEVAAEAGPAALPVGKELCPEAMRGIISRASIFLGSRMHSAIFALQMGVPTIAISYLPKTDGIMRMLKLSQFVCDIQTFNAASLASLAGQAMQSRPYFDEARRHIMKLGDQGKNQFLHILQSSI